MPVISITITESSEQTFPGLPKTITLEASEPSTIFFTLSGEVPNTFSPVYVAPIYLPASSPSITLTIFATNGIDQSAIITQIYSIDFNAIPAAANERLARSAITGLTSGGLVNNYPFGSGYDNSNIQYLNPSQNGKTVLTSNNPNAVSTSFDQDGYPAGFVNEDNDLLSLSQIYNQFTPGTSPNAGYKNRTTGDLPAVDVTGRSFIQAYGPEVSDTSSKFFNAKAFVIYQDLNAVSDAYAPVNIMRANFALENPEIVDTGQLLFNAGLDAPTTTGSFINRHYNARTNQYTYYYRDSNTNRWLISAQQATPVKEEVGALYQMVFRNRQKGDQFVQEWFPFIYRRLI